MRIKTLTLVPFLLAACSDVTPMSGNYAVSAFELQSNSCGTDIDVDNESSVASITFDAPTDTMAIALGDGMAFACDVEDDAFECNSLTKVSSDDRSDIEITYGWHLAGALVTETSIDPLTFTFTATCAGEDCDSLVEQSDMSLPCAVVFQSAAEMQ